VSAGSGEVAPPVAEAMEHHHYWTEHGVHSPPLADEVRLLRAVAHAAWHMLDEGGEHDEGLHVVSSADWQTLSDALDTAGWAVDPHDNARSTGARMAHGGTP
jgi:hypothetical protein